LPDVSQASEEDVVNDCEAAHHRWLREPRVNEDHRLNRKQRFKRAPLEKGKPSVISGKRFREYYQSRVAAFANFFLSFYEVI